MPFRRRRCTTWATWPRPTAGGVRPPERPPERPSGHRAGRQVRQLPFRRQFTEWRAMGAVVVIIGIALMIIIHEGAHFAAAKAYNMKATEAFFGFGPTLVKTTRGETTYGVKAF
ncbi:MAG: hypothetical protein EHM57_03925, partial [Actinobacteria bacterium]